MGALEECTAVANIFLSSPPALTSSPVICCIALAGGAHPIHAPQQQHRQHQPILCHGELPPLARRHGRVAARRLLLLRPVAHQGVNLCEDEEWGMCRGLWKLYPSRQYGCAAACRLLLLQTVAHQSVKRHSKGVGHMLGLCPRSDIRVTSFSVLLPCSSAPTRFSAAPPSRGSWQSYANAVAAAATAASDAAAVATAAAAHAQTTQAQNSRMWRLLHALYCQCVRHCFCCPGTAAPDAAASATTATYYYRCCCNHNRCP